MLIKGDSEVSGREMNGDLGHLNFENSHPLGKKSLLRAAGHTHEDAAVALGETVEDAQDGACPAGAAATPATCRSTWTVQSENGRESPSKARTRDTSTKVA